MDQMHSPVWTTLLHSLLSFAGSLVGILFFLVCFSYFSNAMNRWGRFKRKFILSFLPDASGNVQILSRTFPVVLQMNFLGLIGTDSLNLETIETQLIESQVGELKGGRVKGILLHFDSPGGSAKDCDAIYRRLKAFKDKTKIPIYAYVEGLCASGGFLIACAADKIYASPSSIIGSVGVRLIMPFFNVYKVLQRWEVDVRTYAAGKYKDHLNPFRPWQEEEDEDLRAVLAQFYHRFVDIVVKERSQISREKLIEEYGARIYSSKEAQELKFIDDGSSDYAHVLLAVVKAAAIQEGQPYQVIELVKKRPWIKEMMSKSPFFTGRIDHHSLLDLPFPSSFQGRIAYLFLPP